MGDQPSRCIERLGFRGVGPGDHRDLGHSTSRRMAGGDRLDCNASNFMRCLHCKWWPPPGPPDRTRSFRFGAWRAIGIVVVVIARIRLAREDDTALLSLVERSAVRRFQTVPGLEWVAESDVLSEVLHLGCIRGGTCW